MAMALPHLLTWLWRSDAPVAPPPNSTTDVAEEPPRQQRSKASTRSRSQHKKPSSSSRGRRRGWTELRQVDAEFDMVLVPPDGLSGSDSDDSDWSIGWLEPHSAAFLNSSTSSTSAAAAGIIDEDDDDSSFAVLVPCYGTSSPRLAFAENQEQQQPHWGTLLTTLAAHRNAAEEKLVQQWLSSLQ